MYACVIPEETLQPAIISRARFEDIGADQLMLRGVQLSVSCIPSALEYRLYRDGNTKGTRRNYPPYPKTQGLLRKPFESGEASSCRRRGAMARPGRTYSGVSMLGPRNYEWIPWQGPYRRVWIFKAQAGSKMTIWGLALSKFDQFIILLTYRWC